MNDKRDMQYLALELVKLRLEYKHENTIVNRSDIMDLYEYYLKKLSKKEEDEEKLDLLERENERLSRLISNFEMSNDVLLLKQQLQAIVRENKGNMEQYTYDTIMKAIDY